MANEVTTTADHGRHRPLASARLVSQDKLDKQHYRPGDFWLGRSLKGRPFGWNEEMNLLTCAGPGAGKGVSLVVPNLLEFPGSAVVIDPKGDLATLTAAYRRDVLGHKVIVLDPARTANVPDELRGTYNPFDQLDPTDPLVVSAAQTVASGIVVPNPKAKEPFWDDNALDLIQSVILYMIRYYPAEQRTLMKLRETISLGDKQLFETFVASQRQEQPDFQPDPSQPFDLFLKAMFNTPDFGGVIQETAAKISRMGDNTRGSVLSTAATHLDFVKSPELWNVLGSNDDPRRTFRLPELRRQDRPLTVYLCLPIGMMVRQGRWFRMIVSQIIQFIERSPFDKDRDHPIMMMMDEFFQLGTIPSIVNTLTYARSFGLRLWLIVQDLNQVKSNYPDQWETILGACGIKQFFGVNDMFTAKYVSELLGHEEINVPSLTMTETHSDTESENTSETQGSNLSETGGTSRSTTNGSSFSHSDGTNWGRSSGTNSGSSSGSSSGANWGSNAGASASFNHSPSGSSRTSLDTTHNTGGSTGVSGGSSTGGSSGFNSGISSGSSSGANWGGSSSDTYGVNHSETYGTSRSRTAGSSESLTAGRGISQTSGVSYGFTVSNQTRSLFRPEDVLLAFTKDNMMQLAHIRDQGGMLLFRTPYYADPYFRMKIEDYGDASPETTA